MNSLNGIDVIVSAERRRKAFILGTDTVPQVAGPFIDKVTVLAVQKALLARGFSVGKSGADGLWGKDTAAGIKAMQTAGGFPVTGVIDFGVLQALMVSAPKDAPTQTSMGSSASAAAQDVKNVAENAAVEARKADTAPAVQAVAQVVATAAAATPPAPPDIQAQVKAAMQKAMAAKTAAEVASAQVAVASAATAVAKAAPVSWWEQGAWSNAPVKRWQLTVGAGAAIALSSVLFAFLRRGK